jgi:DNA-directed RNA polymerase subunit beta-beta'
MTGRTRAELRSAWNTNDGGKGVISQIKPDAEMPTTEDGRRADLVINSLGVVNRLNPAQLYESELNFIADKVAEQMRVIAKKEGILLDAYDHMLSFLDLVAPQQAEWMRANVSTDDAVNVALEIIDGKEPIYIHQPPFFGNVSLEQLKAAYEKFEVEKERFVGIEEPLILGTNYYMKLRHEPVSKLSARSAKHLSIGGVPTKNSRGVRTNTEHHSTTPIRLGEQELQNLLIANAPDELKRLLRLYATDDVSREGAIQELLLRGDPFSCDRIEPRGSGTTRPVAGLKALLESIGLRLETGEDGDAAPVMTATMEINEDEETNATDQPPGE